MHVVPLPPPIGGDCATPPGGGDGRRAVVVYVQDIPTIKISAPFTTEPPSITYPRRLTRSRSLYKGRNANNTSSSWISHTRLSLNLDHTYLFLLTLSVLLGNIVTLLLLSEYTVDIVNTQCLYLVNESVLVPIRCP